VDLAKDVLEPEGPRVRWIVLDTIQLDEGNPDCQRRTLNFNLFDIEIDYVASNVRIQEVCSPCRDELISLENFLAVFRPPSVFRQDPRGAA